MITLATASRTRRRWRLAAATSLLALLGLLQLPAIAQLQQLGADAVALDPPGRVARLNLVEGPVSFAPAPAGDESDGNSTWTQAQLNRPLTTGDRLWTDRHARSELHVGSTTVRMNERTSLDFLALDDNTLQLRLSQGTANLRVRNLYQGQRLEVDTPNLAFVISQPGDYRLDVNPAANTTRVVTQAGAGAIYGDSGTPVNLAARQQVTFGGTNLSPAGLGATSLDAFDNWALARDQAEDRSVTARYVPRETVGYQQLDSYGDWTQDPGYGAVWLPRAVPVNWAPYRVGHWSYIRPWGWTWIDDAPWGFAPFHYGRWAQIGPRWAWVPGNLAPRPVYAPALVAFVGGSSSGVSWNLTIGGGAQPALGWFPLAPGEAFVPAYRVSPRYVTQINHNIVVNNVSNTSNVTNITNVTNNYRYARTPAAVTAVSAADFGRSRPVMGNVALTAADLGRAHLVESDRGLPRRAETRESLPATSALPPVAANTRPVVNPLGDRGQRRVDGRFNGETGDRPGRDEDRRDGRADSAPRPQPQAVTGAPVTAVGALATAPAAAAAQTHAAQQDRSAQNVQRRAGLDQERQQREARQAAHAAQTGDESIGQRALREQAQRNNTPAAARPDARTAPDRSQDNSIEQARRAQSQLQREQQRQQRDRVRQQDAQRRQNEESIGKRALREQADAQQQQSKKQADAKPPQRQQQSQERQKEHIEEHTGRQAQNQARSQSQREGRETNTPR